MTSTLCFDSFAKKYLWVGGDRRIWIVDVTTQKIVCTVWLPMPGQVRVIMLYQGDAFFIANSMYSEVYELYHWVKPEYP